MSENYGACRHCSGHGIRVRRNAQTESVQKSCNACGGTGMDGSADRYLEREEQIERDNEWYTEMMASRNDFLGVF